MQKGTFSTPLTLFHQKKKSISAFEKMVSQSSKMKKKEDYNQILESQKNGFICSLVFLSTKDKCVNKTSVCVKVCMVVCLCFRIASITNRK